MSFLNLLSIVIFILLCVYKKNQKHVSFHALMRMHNLRDYLLSITSVKTSLSLLFKKHPKKGAFCVLY